MDGVDWFVDLSTVAPDSVLALMHWKSCRAQWLIRGSICGRAGGRIFSRNLPMTAFSPRRNQYQKNSQSWRPILVVWHYYLTSCLYWLLIEIDKGIGSTARWILIIGLSLRVSVFHTARVSCCLERYSLIEFSTYQFWVWAEVYSKHRRTDKVQMTLIHSTAIAAKLELQVTLFPTKPYHKRIHCKWCNLCIELTQVA